MLMHIITIPFYSTTTTLLEKDGKGEKENYKELFHVSRLFQLYTISSTFVT